MTTALRFVIAFLAASVFPVSAQVFIRWEPGAGGNGHYYALTPAASNWTQAEAAAIALGGHLVSINSAAEQAFIENTFLTGASAQLPLWIGLSDSAVENTFVWSTGEPVTFTRWQAGQPDNAGGTEDYGTINWHRAQSAGAAAGTWNDAPLNGTTGQGGNTDGPYFGIVELFYNVGGPADGNFLVNGSFENTQGTFVNGGGSFMNVAVGATTVPGWTVVNRIGSWIVSPNGFSLTPANGSMFWDLTGTADTTSFAGVSQTIPTIPGERYRLSFSVGSGGNAGPYGGTKAVRAVVPGAAQTFSFTPVSAGSQWMSFELPFTAKSTASTITLTGAGSGTGTAYLGLDHASVVALVTPPVAKVVPGPAANTTFFMWPVPEAGRYQVERSSELATWAAVGNAVTVTGPATLGAVVSAAAGRRDFFRVVKLP